MPVRHETAAVDHQLVLKVLGNLIGYGGHRPFLSLGRQAGTGFTHGNRQSGPHILYLCRKAEGADVPVNRKPGDHRAAFILPVFRPLRVQHIVNSHLHIPPDIGKEPFHLTHSVSLLSF